jgi:hypothetical protein
MTGESEMSTHQLINGVFGPSEANELLMCLIEDKISFHRGNIWSRKERFGETDVASEKRINALRQTKADLAALIAQADAAGQRLAIHCTIAITPQPGS